MNKLHFKKKIIANIKYDITYTLSPFIISDAKNLTILGNIEEKPNFGDSINKITMRLWRNQTIGDLALDKIEELRSITPSDELIKTIYKEVGDSVERVLFIQTILDTFKKSDSTLTKIKKLF
jgi:hypothetical protein